MGQKGHPLGFRLAYLREWKSQWYASKQDFAKCLKADNDVRKYVKRQLVHAGVSVVHCYRTSEKLRVEIHVAKPGVVIGRRGAEITKLSEALEGIAGCSIVIDVVEIKRPETDAQLVADNIAMQIKKRAPFRRAMKKAMTLAFSGGDVQGVKIFCSGRLGGAEMARKEVYSSGKVPLHTLRANIDYGFSESMTIYGVIGVKVWLYKGDLSKKEITDKRQKKVKK